MPNPVKIFEIKGTRWLEGYSLQADAQIGGLFQQALGFDPFGKLGYLQPALTPVQIDDTTITTQINFLTSFVSGGVPYALGLGNRSGTGAKCLYLVNLSTQAVTDKSASIFTHATTGAIVSGGATMFKGRYVYIDQANGSMRSVTVPTIASDTEIQATTGMFSATVPARFHVGSDKNCYFTCPAGFRIGKLTSVSGTSGNTDNIFDIGSGFIRDITGDGYYEVIITDTNDGQVAGISGDCKVYFWDKYKTGADRIWPIDDDYLVSATYNKGAIQIIGKSGIWLCTIDEPPKLVFPFPSSDFLPTNPYSVATKSNVLHWAPLNTNFTNLFLNTFAYGSTIGKSIVYSPFITTQDVTDNQHSAFCSVGNEFLAATTEPGLYLLNSGSTRLNSVVKNAPELLSQPYKFAYAKISLYDALQSGEDVSLTLLTGTGDVINSTITKSYNASRTNRDFVFLPTPQSGSVKSFEDVVALIQPTKAVIKRLAVYGVPQSDADQLLA